MSDITVLLRRSFVVLLALSLLYGMVLVSISMETGAWEWLGAAILTVVVLALVAALIGLVRLCVVLWGN